MSFGAIAGSGNTPDIRGAAASARANGVPSSQATQARFDALEALHLATRKASQQARTDEANPQRIAPQRQAQSSAAEGEPSGQRPALSSSAFLAQSLAQEQDNTAAASLSASQAQSATAAYSAANSRSAPPPQEIKAEILLPLQASLNSGRSLDLAV
ncbi:MAG: hypothetical protein HY055_02460 [Magnetospirillum sp.]|nr:hypothetical protein [Magnetospirillum sp.]